MQAFRLTLPKKMEFVAIVEKGENGRPIWRASAAYEKWASSVY
jgi:hypothetical protein